MLGRMLAPMSDHTPRPATLSETDAARYLGVSPFTLRQSRLARWTKPYRQPRGPAWLKLGRSVRYAVADLDAFLDAHRVNRTQVA